MNPWFRLYTEFASDGKVRAMTDAMQIRLVRLFCLMAKADDIDAMADDEVAFELGVDAAGLAETRAEFERRRFIEPGSWRPRAWDKRQYQSDSSTERVRRYRERHGNGSPKRSGNVSVTPPEQNRSETEQIRPPLPPAERGTPAEPAVGAGVKSAPPQGKSEDPKEVARVAEWADDVFCGTHAGLFVRDAAKTWPVAWVEQAMQDAMASKPRHLAPFCKSILQGWAKAGGPPSAPTPPVNGRGRDSPRPKPPERRMDPAELERIAAERRKELATWRATTN